MLGHVFIIAEEIMKGTKCQRTYEKHTSGIFKNVWVKILTYLTIRKPYT